MMEATTPGKNRTGTATALAGVESMMNAVLDLSPPVPINTRLMDAERLEYIGKADSVGSIPPPMLLKGAMKRGEAKLSGVSPSLFLDKLGERIAFERTSTRLYDALIAKYLALNDTEGDVMPRSSAAHEATSLQTLRRIRAEELGHFRMLAGCMQQLGGDPTALTPCADTAGAASMGFVQVLTDPRTTMAQCLNTILIAELADNAGWDLLIELAEEAGQTELTEQFSQALIAEQEHLVIIKDWLKSLLLDEANTTAV